MRKRKYLIGALLGVFGAFALASTASAAVLSQSYKASVNTSPTSGVPVSGAFDKKKYVGVNAFRNDVDTTYGPNLPADYTPAANRTVLTFDPAFQFRPAGVPVCSTLGTTETDEQARAECPTALVGQGAAQLKSTGGGTINARVAAFNGPVSGGKPSIVLHVDPAGLPTKQNLVGVLSNNTLDVSVPVTPTVVIVHFDTTINKVKSSGAAAASSDATSSAKKKKKKKKTPLYYIMVRCNDKQWNHSETTTFTDGSTKSGSYTQPCKQKKKKKKKK
jgi:hypothetical protein